MKIAFNPSTVAALIAPPNNKDITFDLRGHNIFARGVKFCGTDTNTWRDIKINNVSIDSNTLDLRDGSNTTLTNINGVVTINSTWRPVVDNLTSDSTTSSLSANQGRVLVGLINGKSDSEHNHDDRYYTKAESNAKYITDITTSVNKLTFTKNGSNIDKDIKVNVVYSQGNLTNISDKNATTKASSGLFIYNSYNQVIGTNSYSSVLSINTGGTIQIAGNWGDDQSRNLYWRSQSDRDVSSYPWKSWRTILDSENYSSILDSRYYTESEVDNLLDAKLNRQNLSYGTWNPRGYNLAADYSYNGGDLSISESEGKIHISVDGYFWQNEGQYRVLDTSDVAGFLRWKGMQNIGNNAPFQAVVDIIKDTSKLNDGGLSFYSYAGDEYTVLIGSRNDATRHGNALKWGYANKYLWMIRMINGSPKSSDWEKISAGYADSAGSASNLTVHQYLSNTDTTWWPLIWGGSSHNNTSDSTGEVYKSHDVLSWQTSSQTLYATHLRTTYIDLKNSRGISQVTSGGTSPYKGIKLPDLQSNGIGIFSRVGNSTDEGGIILSEDTCVIYNSFDAGWGLSVRDKDLNQTDISSDDTVAFGIRQNYKLYSRGGFEKKDSSDNYVLLGGGGHQTISSLSVNYANSAGNADTVDGYHADNIQSAGWRSLYRTGGSSNVIKWTRIGRCITNANDNAQNDGMIEFHTNGDQNYKYFGYGRLQISQYAQDSRSLMLQSFTSEGIHFYATIDEDNYIWLGHNAWWSGNSAYRVIWSGSYIEWYSSGMSMQTSNPNSVYVTDNGTFKKPNETGFVCLNNVYVEASKLKTPRTIWGQSFDGTRDVSGSLSNTGTITASTAATYDIGSNALDYRYGYFQWIGAKSNTNLRLAANNSDNQIVLHTNGNVGIGTNSPTEKLTVNGWIGTNGIYTNRTGSSTDGGVSLYSNVDPMTYGIAFRGTGTYGTHGYVTSASDWATYLTMNDSTTRGWIFRRGDTNVASIAGSGNMAIGQHLEFSNGAHISTNMSTDYHYGYTFNLGDNTKSIGMYSGPVGEAGGVVISPDGCLIYNSSDCGYNLQVRDKDLGSDLTNIATLTFGIEQSGYYAWSRGGFRKNGSSDSYVLLGGGGHKLESSLNVNYANSAGNADTLDGYHENSFLRYRGATGTDQEATLWDQIGIKQYNNALPDNLTGVYNYGSVISLPGYSSRFEIYASHQSSSGDGLYYRSGWGSDKRTWLKFIDSSNIGSQSVKYASSAGNADTLDGEHAYSFVRAGHYESADLNKLDTYSFIRSVNSNNNSTSPKGDTGWYNVIQLVHRNGSGDGPGYIGQIALGMTTNTNDMFFRGKRTDPWKTVIHSGNYTEFINNYYWANVKISTSSSTTTSPTVYTLTATNSIRMGNILLEHTDEINNSANGWLHLNYRNSGNITLCYGGGTVSIGTVDASYKLSVMGNTCTKGFIIRPCYLSIISVTLSNISPGDGYVYRCLEIGSSAEISCIIADKVALSNERGVLIKFNTGYDGQIVLLKDLQNYGDINGNGYFWVMPSGCKIIRPDGSSTQINYNQISNAYDDGKSRFFVYSFKYNAWIEFYCS